MLHRWRHLGEEGDGAATKPSSCHAAPIHTRHLVVVVVVALVVYKIGGKWKHLKIEVV